MKTFNRIALVLTFACVSLVQVVAQEPSLEGVYTVVGANPNGKEYQAVLEIKANEVAAIGSPSITYAFRWTTGKDPTGEWLEAYGYGFITGGRLTVIIQDQTSGGFVVASYAPVNGVWKGVWSPAGSGVILTEDLTKSDKTADFLKELLPVPGQQAL